MLTSELAKLLENELAEGKIESPRFEANQIASATNGDEKKARQMVERRLNGEPLQYILGEWEFYGITLKVGEGVLIPRADTETVVEVGTELLKGVVSPSVFDLCAGSGCIGIALSKHTGAKVKFVEKSNLAIKYLMENLKLTATDGDVYEADVLELPQDDFVGTADMIISNPPYIRSEVILTLQKEVQFEPKMALDGGSDGLLFYREISKKWKDVLKKGGYLVFEIGFDQACEVAKILKNEGYNEVTIKKDLCNNSRVVYGKKQ